MPVSRIVILGAHGGLGRALLRAFAPVCEVLPLTRAELNLERPEEVGRVLERLPFDVLLNPAGMTSPDACEVQPEKAWLANVVGPQAVAESCQKRGQRMVQFSTDYVFDGQAVEAYDEQAEAAPINVYGHTKRAGELAVLKAAPGALVARVSWLFGPDKPSHPDQIIQRARDLAEVTAVADKVSAPTSHADLSAWVREIVQHRPEASGVLHLCNSGVASWHTWAEATLHEAARLGLPLKTQLVRAIHLGELTQLKAPRPLMTLMSNRRLQELLGREVRSWEVALKEYLQQQYACA